MLLQKYDDIIKEQEEIGITEPGNDLESSARRSVRTVYDASANKNGPSSNEMLKTGPCLLPKIFEILLRARCHKFLLVIDI